MTWYKPWTWFSSEVVDEVEQVIVQQVENFIYAKIDLGHKHAGLGAFAETMIFQNAIKVIGIDLDNARTELTGRVIDFEKMINEDLQRLEKVIVEMTIDQLKSILK